MSAFALLLLLTIPAVPPGLPSTAAAPAEKLSLAERIVRAERMLEAERKLLADLKAQFADPKSSWSEAEESFKKLDGQLEEARLRKKRWEERTDPAQAARKAEILKQLETELPRLEADWAEARKSFNQGLELRKTLQEKADALALKIKQDEAAFAKLKGDDPKPNGEQNGAAEPSKTGPAPAAAAAPPPANPAPPVLASPLAASLAPAPAAAGNSAKPNVQLDMAQREAQQREEALAAARDKTRSISERVEALKKNIEIEQKLLVANREKSDADRRRQLELDEEMKRRQREGAPDAEIQALWKKVSETEKSFTEARAITRAGSVRVSQLQEELTNLQAEQITALQEEAKSRRDVESARQRVAELKNPYTLTNLLQWLIDRGPYILLTLVGMWGLHRLVRASGERLAKVMAQHALRGSGADRENRAKTLVSVFSNAASLLIFGGGGIMILDALGVPIIPLMGGAAIFGLALAFGAQNLVKDYFAGFMVLLEDQYSVNDVVKIGEVSGVVESISLRMTALRDGRGVVHFIPHSAIQTVSNMTHGWSRAHFEIGVAYKENVDRVMEILLGLAKELRRDPFFGTMILDEAEMLGVDAFADSAVVIKFFLKTQPLQQWKVQRELLRRIKNRFDELRIEFPFPQRTVHHRYEEQGPEALGTRKAA